MALGARWRSAAGAVTATVTGALLWVLGVPVSGFGLVVAGLSGGLWVAHSVDLDRHLVEAGELWERRRRARSRRHPGRTVVLRGPLGPPGR